MKENENPMEVNSALQRIREAENSAKDIISAAESEAAGMLKQAQVQGIGLLADARALAEKTAADIKERLRLEGLRRCVEISDSCESEVRQIVEKSGALEEQALRLLREKINK